MIIHKPIKNGDTVSFKLSSGEEIVARLDEETPTSFKISKPMVLIVQTDESMGLAPFMFSVGPKGKFEMQKTSVACTAKTDDNIAKQYTASTTGVMIN